MAKNLILTPRTGSDIDKRVERVLKGLGNPEPPLRLEDVRELLALDVKFYTADDPGLAQEVFSRLTIAAKQVLRRPGLLIDAVRANSLQALYIPDEKRKRILLDESVPKLKHRWNEAHEVGHSLLPWHESAMHGDNEFTLSRDCHALVEAEANFAAGRLLFMRDRFQNEVRSLAPTIGNVELLRKRYGNTLSTTLYRFVESLPEDRPAVGMITCHPHVIRRAASFNPLDPCKHVIQSPVFHAQFGHTTESELFATIVGYCGAQRGGMLGHDEVELMDRNGQRHEFYFETFFNRYDALTIGVWIRRVPTSVVAGYSF